MSLTPQMFTVSNPIHILVETHEAGFAGLSGRDGLTSKSLSPGASLYPQAERKSIQKCAHKQRPGASHQDGDEVTHLANYKAEI